MSFRKNLQHLRAARNITQEQLAMLLGVSRQSVSKWESERAYPEMDKLLKLCDLFGCTLDELVTGDLTACPVDEVPSMSHAKAPQDVTGYDQAMQSYARRVSLGVSIIILGIALFMLLSRFVLAPGVDPTIYGGVAVFAGIAVGSAFILFALFERRGFILAHPFVEDFYTHSQKKQARSVAAKGLIAGIGLVMAGFAAILLLQGDEGLASTVFLTLLAASAFAVTYGYLMWLRCNLASYNQKALSSMDELEIDALDDEELKAFARKAKRKRSAYGFVMLVATAIGLVLLFVPQLNAQRWFFLAWVIGGLACASISAFHSMRKGE